LVHWSYGHQGLRDDVGVGHVEDRERRGKLASAVTGKGG
jgi:hypothetical protein